MSKLAGYGRDAGEAGSISNVRAMRASAVASSVIALTVAIGGLAISAAPVRAQDSWNPFAENNGIRPPRRDPRPAVEQSRPVSPADDGDGPPAGRSGAPGAPSSARETVERADLAPLDAVSPAAPLAPLAPVENAPQPAFGPRSQSSVAGGRAAGPGYDPRALEPLWADLAIPSRSPAVTSLLRRLLAGPDAVLQGSGPEQIGIKAEALYRIGLAAEALALFPGPVKAGDNPILTALVARIALAAGTRDQACEAMRLAMPARADLPPKLKVDMLAIQGYCAALAGNSAGAGLAATLAREEGAGSPDTLAALDAVAAGDPPALASAKQLVVLDFRLAQTSSTQIGNFPLERAEPALVAVVAADANIDPQLRLEAAETASRMNAIDSAALATAYREQSFTADDLSQAQSAPRTHPAMRRAQLFRAAETERTPAKKTRLVRQTLDEARRAGLYLPIAAALSRTVDQIEPAVEISWFAETAVETQLVAGQYEKARNWTRYGQQAGTIQDHAIGPLSHWLALIDIADPQQTSVRGEYLGAVEQLALHGRFTTDALHRLATVLDALDYDVPHRLWEAASRAPQPNAGYLPPTGVLTDLQDAARRRDQARTILLVIRALGVGAGEGAHIIALGDSIRALRRAGLEREARQLGLEALFAVWPRTQAG